MIIIYYSISMPSTIELKDPWTVDDFTKLNNETINYQYNNQYD